MYYDRRRGMWLLAKKFLGTPQQHIDAVNRIRNKVSFGVGGASYILGEAGDWNWKKPWEAFRSKKHGMQERNLENFNKWSLENNGVTPVKTNTSANPNYFPNKKQKTMPRTRSRSARAPSTPNRSRSRSTARGRNSSRNPSSTRSMSISRSRARSAHLTTARTTVPRVRVRPAPHRSDMSGGFVTGLTRRTSKRVKKAVGGIVSTEEYGREYKTSRQVGWVGHTSASTFMMWKNMWRLLIKELFYKTGHPIKDMNEQLDYVTAADSVQVAYQTGDGTVLTAAHTIAIGNTAEIVATAFYNNAGLRAETITLKWINFATTVNPAASTSDRSSVRIDLEFCTVDMYCKSSMKMQNRTVTDATDNLESLDSVPLYGKAYGGKGNGPNQPSRVNSAITTQLVGDYITGIIESSSGDPGLDEPIHRVYFDGAKLEGKLRIEPSQIKTSVLTYSRKMSLNLMRKLLSDSITNPRSRTPLATFRFFGLERMIQVNTPAADNIIIAYETNNYVSMTMKMKKPKFTVPMFSHTNIP